MCGDTHTPVLWNNKCRRHLVGGTRAGGGFPLRDKTTGRKGLMHCTFFLAPERRGVVGARETAAG